MRFDAIYIRPTYSLAVRSMSSSLFIFRWLLSSLARFPQVYLMLIWVACIPMATSMLGPMISVPINCSEGSTLERDLGLIAHLSMIVLVNGKFLMFWSYISFLRNIFFVVVAPKYLFVLLIMLVSDSRLENSYGIWFNCHHVLSGFLFPLHFSLDTGQGLPL